MHQHVLSLLWHHAEQMTTPQAAATSAAGSAVSLGLAGAAKADLLSTMTSLPELTEMLQFLTASGAFLTMLGSAALLVIKYVQDRKERQKRRNDE